MSKNYFYRAICTDGRGWDAMGAEGVWGSGHARPQDRIFATAREAWELVRETRNAGCWTVEEDDGSEHEEVPEVTVEKCAGYEACWMDPDFDQEQIDRIVHIHGRLIKFASMPNHVAEFMIAKFGGTASAYGRASASMVGASSLTHTYAFAHGIWESRVTQIADLLKGRVD